VAKEARSGGTKNPRGNKQIIHGGGTISNVAARCRAQENRRNRRMALVLRIGPTRDRWRNKKARRVDQNTDDLTTRKPEKREKRNWKHAEQLNQKLILDGGNRKTARFQKANQEWHTTLETNDRKIRRK